MQWTKYFLESSGRRIWIWARTCKKQAHCSISVTFGSSKVLFVCGHMIFHVNLFFFFSTGFWVTIKSRNFWMALSLVCHHWNDCKFLFVLFSILEHLKILYTVNILWLWKSLSGYLNSSLVKKKYTIILLKRGLTNIL